MADGTVPETSPTLAAFLATCEALERLTPKERVRVLRAALFLFEIDTDRLASRSSEDAGG